MMCVCVCVCVCVCERECVCGGRPGGLISGVGWGAKKTQIFLKRCCNIIIV